MHKKLCGLAVAAIAAVAMLSGCESMREANPLEVACTAAAGQAMNVELCAYTTYGLFTVFEEQGVKVATDLQERAASATDPEVRSALLKTKNGIIAADERAKPIADNLQDTLTHLEQIRAEIAAGQSTEEQLAIVNASLLRWTNDAGPVVQALIDAVRGK
jgi:hypothetical protein